MIPTIFGELFLGIFLTAPAYFAGFYGVKGTRAVGRGLSRLTLETQLVNIPRTMRGKTVYCVDCCQGLADHVKRFAEFDNKVLCWGCIQKRRRISNLTPPPGGGGVHRPPPGGAIPKGRPPPKPILWSKSDYSEICYKVNYYK